MGYIFVCLYASLTTKSYPPYTLEAVRTDIRFSLYRHTEIF